MEMYQQSILASIQLNPAVYSSNSALLVSESFSMESTLAASHLYIMTTEEEKAVDTAFLKGIRIIHQGALAK